ncbi:thioredoxin domain-containing protein [Rhodopirellula bahusiensis]|uniref:RedB n=1 Tax=Rhodopirellula bahusiensis TaxID=2014065 RepID=A0A2G1W4C0_9BACT|nr:RedB [Rhodopirellula bahusiensis]PHQ33863.1 RedB [Rhodopirellula bahusiensis]
MLHQENASGFIQNADLLEVRPITKKIPPYLVRVAVLWGCVLVGLFFALIAYGTTPGESDLPPGVAPFRNVSGFLNASSTTEWEIVMAVHPKCPCTVASVNELNRLLDKVDDNVRCRFLVFHPVNSTPDWMNGKISSRLACIPRSVIQADEGGETAFELGMKTSGAVIVFDPRGKSRFHGGITVSRNHEGDNLGVRSISMLIQGKTPPLTTTPVYGCSL